MEDSIKAMEIIDFDEDMELNNSENQYNFEKVLSNPLILYNIFQFMEKDNIKSLSFCSKKIYKRYCDQIKKLKVKEGIEESIISNIKFDKYENLIELDLGGCKNFKDSSIISNLVKLENLNLSDTNISDISFLEKNKNIKVLNLANCSHIKDYLFISHLEKLENLNLHNSKISDISFLEKNKNIKVLNLKNCTNIKDFSFISNLEKLEILNLYDSTISDISFLEKNKNMKKLDLTGCRNIKNYSFISNLEYL